MTVAGPALLQPLTAATSVSGSYRFPNIPVGTYLVSFELQGFQRVVFEGVRIQAGFNAEVNGKLELSTVEETVTVTGESRSSTPSRARSGPTSARSCSRRFRRRAIRG